MTLWQVGVTDMNTIFLLHVGQLGNTGGTPLEDTPAAGMSAPPYSVRVCGVIPSQRTLRNKSRLRRRQPYFLSRSSPFSQPFVSVVHMGSGWPQSAHRSTRWLLPLASMCFIVFWHLAQTAGEDWIWDMMHPWIRRERNTLSHRWRPMAGR